MIIELFKNNIDERKIRSIVKTLEADGIIVVPTDTVYALACSIDSNKAFEKICRFKNVKPEKANFSFLCSDLKDISFYTKPFDRNIYKLLNKNLPGAFTFILEASSNVPSIFRSKKKTIGIRIPDHQVTLKIIEMLGCPLMATSLHNSDDAIADYLTDPKEIFEKFENAFDLIVDSGNGGNIPSTVIDCASGDAVIIRQGLGEL